MNLAGKNRAEGLLAAVIIARSTSFVFNKLGLGTISLFNLLAVRFLLAFLLLMLLFGRRLRRYTPAPSCARTGSPTGRTAWCWGFCR